MNRSDTLAKGNSDDDDGDDNNTYKEIDSDIRNGDRSTYNEIEADIVEDIEDSEESYNTNEDVSNNEVNYMEEYYLDLINVSRASSSQVR